MVYYDYWGEQLFKTNEIGIYGGWDDSFKQTKCRPRADVWGIFVGSKEVERGTPMLIKVGNYFLVNLFCEGKKH